MKKTIKNLLLIISLLFVSVNANAKELVTNETAVLKTKVKVSNALKKQSDTTKDLKRYGISYFKSKMKIDLGKIITPNSYVLNINDEVSIKIFGLNNKDLDFTLDKKGDITIPIYGPLHLAGVSFVDSKELITNVLLQLYPNSKSTINISKYASIGISITGEVKTAGIYYMPPFSTIVDLVLKAKGIKNIGTLRNIQLKRDNKISNIDFYDVVNGKINFDKLTLKNGDSVHIPVAKKLIYLDGAIKQKGIFELKEGETLSHLLKYSKGLLPQANQNNITIKRYINNSEVKLISVSLSNKDFILFDGDYILVSALSFTDISKIDVQGAINNPNEYKLSEYENTLQSVIKKAGGLTPKANRNRILITRVQIIEDKKTLKRIFVKYDDNLTLKAFDKITIFELSNWDNEITVNIQGAVKYPNKYVLQKGESINTLLSLSGGYTKSANIKGSHLYRKSLQIEQDYIIEQNIIKLQSAIITLSVNTISSSNEENKLTLINLKKDLELMKSSSYNVNSYISLDLKNDRNELILKNEDVLIIPEQSNTVQVVGEVVGSASFVFEENKNYEYYVNKAGGITNEANLPKAYIKKTNKEIQLMNINTIIQAGDVIVIPKDIFTGVK